MEAAEWDEIFELFHAARERSGPERISLLDSVCGDNSKLRKAVEDLLKEDEAASGFLSRPVFIGRTPKSAETPVYSGKRLGRYTLETLIGRGGMGEVWSAHDTDLDRKVALKFLSSDALAALDPQQIIREAKAASALNHPGVVTIHEVVQDGSTFAIVMELVPGQPLRGFCSSQMVIPRVIAIGHQIAEALSAAHASGTVHGDIKPENILARPDGYIKIVDFGLARKLSAETIGTPPALGTLRYLSPEQARGECLTPASDIFSFGLVLYELLTGQHAFASSSSIETTQAILTRDLKAPSTIRPSLSPPLNKLICTMLAKNPSERPTAKEAADLFEQLQGQRRGLKQNSFRAALVISLCALIAAAGALLIWQRTQPPDKIASLREITTLISENRATASALSPDGLWAAYANADGIFVRSIQNGETKTLPKPPNLVVDRLAWFTDQTKLIASGFSSNTQIPSIWLISVVGHAPKLLQSQARDGQPSPDGTQLIFTSADRSEIREMDFASEKSVHLTGESHDRFELVWWRAGEHSIMCLRNQFSQTDDRRFLESVEVPSGKVTSSTQQPMISSATSLPDGRLLFLTYANNNFVRSNRVWEIQTDRTTGALVGKPRRIAAISDQKSNIFDLSASADGKRAMVLQSSEHEPIFVGDFFTNPRRIANIHRLTLDERPSFPHAWTPDNRSVIFESNRNGDFELFKQAADRHTAETFVSSAMAAILPQVTPHGDYVLYAAHVHEVDGINNPSKLMRIPINGGTPVEVPIGGPLDEIRCSLRPAGRCVLRTTKAGAFREYYELDPVRGKGALLARITWSAEVLWDWDVSPDGSEVAIPIHGSHGRIRVVKLNPAEGQQREREIVAPGLSDIKGLTWAADGSGWFVSLDTTVGNRLIFVSLSGRVSPLGDIQGWVVPSRNGKRVAFLDRSRVTNAWLIERQ
jgi:eukaryotic-like serine/threonine-protein kinase